MVVAYSHCYLVILDSYPYPICMRAAAALGILLALVLGSLAIGQIDTLQDTGETLTSGALLAFFRTITSLAGFVVAFIAFGTLVAFAVAAIRR